jgi:cytochrome c-type biogenesis protein CcmH/NrfG
MSAPENPAPSSISTTLVLAKALALARRGQIKAAQELLSPSGGAPEEPAELHALAALVTRTGDFPRALTLWRQLLQRDPRHAEARRMIAAIELWEFRPPWYRFIPAGAACLGIALIVGVLLYMLS